MNEEGDNSCAYSHYPGCTTPIVVPLVHRVDDKDTQHHLCHQSSSNIASEQIQIVKKI